MTKRRRRNHRKKIIYVRFIFIIILIFITIRFIQNGFARYRSTATSQADVDLAYYFVKAGDISQDLKLERILPRTNKYTYSFSVANYDGNTRTETSLDYTIEIKTTTNLPLNYKICKQGETTDRITSTQPIADDDGTYFKYITATGDTFGFSENEVDYYQIEIEFPVEYNSSQYEGIVEYLQLTVYSTQKTSN